MPKRPEIPEGTPLEVLVAACGAGLRAWTVNADSIIGMTEVAELLIAEYLSAVHTKLTADEVAELLRGLADRIERGALTPTMQ